MHFKTMLIAATLAAATAAPAAAADKFTSSSTGEKPTVLIMPAVGPTPEARVAHWKGTITSTFADGPRNSTYECVGYPGNNANLSICQGKEGDNTFSFRITCPQGAGACFGSLMGTGGRYKGRTGSFVQTSTGPGTTESQGSWH